MGDQRKNPGRTKRSIERKNGQPGSKTHGPGSNSLWGGKPIKRGTSDDALKAALFEMLMSGDAQLRRRGAESDRLNKRATNMGTVRLPKNTDLDPRPDGKYHAPSQSYDDMARFAQEDPNFTGDYGRMYLNQPFPRVLRDGELMDARSLYEVPANLGYLAAGTMGVAKEGAEDMARNILKGIFGR